MALQVQPHLPTAAEHDVKRRLHYRRPWLYEAQENAIFTLARFAFIEASTKSGKTLGALIWLFEQLLQGSEGDAVWWVAPWFRASRIAYRRMRFALRHWPQLFRHNDSEMTITAVPIGATMFFLSGENPDSLYGEDVKAAVIDEASRCREEAFHAVRTTLTATGGPLRCIGNVKGRRNWFYRLARQAEASSKTDAERTNTHYAKFTWRDACSAGLVDEQDIREAQAMLPTNVFKELYEAEAADDSGNPFTYRKTTMAKGPAVAWGWDLGKSVDWTVGIGLNSKGQVCAVERVQFPWEETIVFIKTHTGRAKALVDSTGVGDPIVERLQRTEAEEGAEDTRWVKDQMGGNFEGFKFTSPSKQQLMEGLALALREWLRVPEGVVTAELDVFEYVYTRTGVRYSAPSGSHDDAVCALALAAWLWVTEFKTRAAISAAQIVGIGGTSKWKGH